MLGESGYLHFIMIEKSILSEIIKTVSLDTDIQRKLKHPLSFNIFRKIIFKSKMLSVEINIQLS